MLYVVFLLYLLVTEGYEINFQSKIPIKEDIVDTISDAFRKLTQSNPEYDESEIPSLSKFVKIQVQRVEHRPKISRQSEWPIDEIDPNDRFNLPPIKFEDLDGDVKDKLLFLKNIRDFRSDIKVLDETHIQNRGTPYPNFLLGRYFRKLAGSYRVTITSYAEKPLLTFWGNETDYKYEDYRPGCYPGWRPDQPHLIIDDLVFIAASKGSTREYVLDLLNSTIRANVDAEDFEHYNLHSYPFPDHEIELYYQDVAKSFNMRIATFGGKSIEEYWDQLDG